MTSNHPQARSIALQAVNMSLGRLLLLGLCVAALGQTPRTDDTDYTLWSKDDTYFETCRRHYIGNHTWGRPLGKWVDKAHAKKLVAAMGIEGLKIPRTYDLYDKKSIGRLTVAKLRQIPQPYIIKATHMVLGATPGPVGWHDRIVDAHFPHPQALHCHAQEHQNLKEFARKGRVRFPAG